MQVQPTRTRNIRTSDMLSIQLECIVVLSQASDENVQSQIEVTNCSSNFYEDSSNDTQYFGRDKHFRKMS